MWACPLIYRPTCSDCLIAGHEIGSTVVAHVIRRSVTENHLDAVSAAVENGIVQLVCVTTETPFFSLIAPSQSRFLIVEFVGRDYFTTVELGFERELA